MCVLCLMCVFNNLANLICLFFTKPSFYCRFKINTYTLTESHTPLKDEKKKLFQDCKLRYCLLNTNKMAGETLTNGHNLLPGLSFFNHV